MTQIRNTWVEFGTRVLKYAALGIIAVPLSILTHELGHFFAYQLFGASNVQLHSVSVSADKEILTSFQLATANLVGPIISYLTIGLAFILTRKKYIPFWVILAIAAPIGRIVNFVYVYFRALGYTPNPNFDEFNFSRTLNIEPLWLSALTILAVLATMFFFLRKAWRAGRFGELASVVISIVAGLAVWMLVGGLILP
jgi:hypothetical protein